MLILYALGEVSMNKFLSVLVAGLIAGSLSVSAFAADAAKPAVDAAKVKTTVAVKKDSAIKTTVKKLAPNAKKTDLKLK
jgi:hypothetical protein